VGKHGNPQPLSLGVPFLLGGGSTEGPVLFFEDLETHMRGEVRVSWILRVGSSLFACPTLGGGVLLSGLRFVLVFAGRSVGQAFACCTF